MKNSRTASSFEGVKLGIERCLVDFHRVNGQKGRRASAKEVTRPEHPGLCIHIKDL